MQLVEIGVTYRKQVSDGNFGTESAECTLRASVDDNVDRKDTAADLAAMLFADARQIVYQKLDESPSLAVRRALRSAERV